MGNRAPVHRTIQKSSTCFLGVCANNSARLPFHALQRVGARVEAVVEGLVVNEEVGGVARLHVRACLEVVPLVAPVDVERLGEVRGGDGDGAVAWEVNGGIEVPCTQHTRYVCYIDKDAQERRHTRGPHQV